LRGALVPQANQPATLLAGRIDIAIVLPDHIDKSTPMTTQHFRSITCAISILVLGIVPGKTVAGNPNHLEPAPAYDPNGYHDAVCRSLVGQDVGELWMVTRFSFSPETAVVLRHEVERNPKSGKTESDKWVLEYTKAKSMIWQWKETSGRQMELDIKVTNDVFRQRVEVSQSFVDAISKPWEAVVRQTRYATEGYRGLDGVTYQFYHHYALFGETWSPNEGLPLMMVNLGRALGELARSSPKTRPPLESACLNLARTLQQEVAKTKR
jgi:hypothetical protein